MHTIKTPSSLKWLINKKARIEGEIKYIEAITPSKIERSRIKLEEAERNYRALVKAHERHLNLVNVKLPILQRQFEAIRAAIGIHEIQINPDLIRPIRPQTRKRLLPFGQLTRDIYACLKYLGDSASTKQIARYIMEKHAVLDEDANLVMITGIVRKRLQKLVQDGKVIRVHPRITTYEGAWKLPS